MEVVVFGKHVEVSAALRATTLEKIERISKFAGDVRRVEVDFGEIASRRSADSQTCEILVHLNKHLVKGHAASVDHVSALDRALDRVENQMRKLHQRRVERKPRKSGGNGATAPVAAAAATPLEALLSSAASEQHEEPLIVKTKQFSVKPMDPEEAALQMELLGHDFYLFTSSDHGRAAVIYRRGDGHYGLIESAG